MRSECVWCKGGFCHHIGRPKKCRPSDESWFNFAKPMHQLWIDQLCEYQNPMDCELLTVTEDDIQALKNGKILAFKGNIFIALKEG